MNTGTRLTLLQSKGMIRYAIKTGSGWVEETIIPDAKPIRRELSKQRLMTMIEALLTIQRDVDPLDNYNPNPFYDTSDETLDRVFGPRNPDPLYDQLD